jgi:NADP-dependent 3-hydroxy acid dehydrogenase YdfG
MNGNNTYSKKVALVTGSSSGIGLETSLTLAENNYRTYATMRKIDKASNVLELAKKRNVALKTAKLDVNDDYSVQQVIKINSRKRKSNRSSCKQCRVYTVRSSGRSYFD